MTIDVGTLLRVLDACEEASESEPLVSLVFPKKGGGSAQIFLPWKRGKKLKDYISHPSLTGVWNVHQAMRSRILDHENRKRRITDVLREGDEIRFVRAG
jgi:hypothetical protein